MVELMLFVDDDLVSAASERGRGSEPVDAGSHDGDTHARIVA